MLDMPFWPDVVGLAKNLLRHKNKKVMEKCNGQY